MRWLVGFLYPVIGATIGLAFNPKMALVGGLIGLVILAGRAFDEPSASG